MGLVNFDGILSDYPYRQMLGVESPAPRGRPRSRLRNTHPITHTYDTDRCSGWSVPWHSPP